jgi:hypothetical protein
MLKANLMSLSERNTDSCHLESVSLPVYGQKEKQQTIYAFAVAFLQTKRSYERCRNMETTAGMKFYQDQLDYLFAKDVDGLIDNHYHEDALLAGLDFEVRGRDALKVYFRKYLETLGKLELKSTDLFRETPDTIFLEAHVQSSLGPAIVYDAFVIKDGKATYHFTGVK